jgi:aspartate-semialdehyde dehydrogenase
MNIAIVGATGNVGRKILEVIEKINFKFDQLYLIASDKSIGKNISFKNKDYSIVGISDFDFSKVRIAFFSAGSSIAEKWAPIAAKKTIVIDNSKYFRMDKDIPLVVPEVNSSSLAQYKNKNIIANANCSTIQLVLALKPIHDKFKIKRVVVSTYQSVSGGGKNHMMELEEQTKSVLENKKVEPKNFTKQIAFNVIPHIDSFMADGSTKEEWKMVVETKKILDPNINLTATCVRVPVFVGHSESANIEFENNIDLEKVKSCLTNAPGCKVVDEHKDGGYVTPAEIDGDFTTYISRIREDKTQKNCINMWIVSDNLLKGAALNAIQIAQLLYEKYLNN